ncbi:hypothetical protein [Sphingomonas sp. LM7]|uniref:hypothetical protein n=1 Tax=Sphingomonas sp. LM7 TaxID=1938607 RepID=UPI000983B876|nr:hypothetical protein [Sphingomonas sp. LM7]AQR74318.1 hypothetical protein BXU08_12235 [Sphingomonas sp. LM7]
MRAASVFAAILAFAPLPAAADVTARYDLGKEQLSVEVDDGGDYRAEVAGKFALMRRGGVVHLVIYRDGTPLVVPRQAFLDLAETKLAKERAKPGAAPVRIAVTKGPDETVAGRKGSLWTLMAPESGGKAIEVVLTGDADLVPVGAVFVEVLDTALQAFDGIVSHTDFAVRAREVLAKGTPLRLKVMEEVRLREVSTAAIDSARFVLPGPVIDGAALDEAMSAPAEPATPLPPLP